MCVEYGIRGLGPPLNCVSPMVHTPRRYTLGNQFRLCYGTGGYFRLRAHTHNNKAFKLQSKQKLLTNYCFSNEKNKKVLWGLDNVNL